MRRARILAAGGMAASAIAVVIAASVGGGADPGVANLWVNTTAGASPARCATACEYDATKAYGTFDAAEAAAAPGDTVRVKAGAYPAQVINGGGTNTTDAADVTFIPAQGEQPTITSLDLDAVDDLTIEGLTFAGAYKLIELDVTNHITIRGNDILLTQPSHCRSLEGEPYISEAASAGIQVSRSTVGFNYDLLIEDNHIDRAADGQPYGMGDGIDFAAGDPTGNVMIRGNLIENNGGDAIHIETSNTADQPIVVEDNVARYSMKHIGPDCVEGSEDDAHTDMTQVLGSPYVVYRRNFGHDIGHGVLMTNNDMPPGHLQVENTVVMVSGTGNALNLGDTAASLTSWDVHNFLAYQPAGASLTMDSPETCNDSPCVFSNSIVAGDAEIGVAQLNSTFRASGTVHASSLAGVDDADLFLSTSAGSSDDLYPPRVAARFPNVTLPIDLRLKTGSPAIGLADAAGAPATDLLGRTRDGDPDAGPYERLPGDP